MRKLLLLYSALFLFLHSGINAQVHPPRCGLQQLKEALIAQDPSWTERFAAQKSAMQATADAYIAQQKESIAERTTATTHPVPVIFHIVVDSAQYYQLGGTAGIAIRCDSQIAVLNRDFNRYNPDSTAIPVLWKPYYASTGIRFGLARVAPDGSVSPGYEVKIISGSSTTDAGFSNEGSAFSEAKTAGTGLVSWDVNKYYNVWCINFTGTSSTLLGLTLPKSYCTSTTLDKEGVCILYRTLGCTAADGTPPPGTGGTAGWYSPYNLGRTLTHETGHFFEIWHPWGDDGGQCPTWSTDTTVNFINCYPGIGSDDGLSDTPPESDAVTGNPTYNVPGGTETDCCQMHAGINTQPIGIACLSYMDYTDDEAMHLFTNMQAASMAAIVLVPISMSGTGANGYGTTGENYELTQNPSLLGPATAVTEIAQPAESLNIFPNPSSGIVTLTLNAATDIVNEVVILNLLGQQVMRIPGQNKDYYSIDLSAMSKGIYFIKCNFASGSITRKILLQ